MAVVKKNLEVWRGTTIPMLVEVTDTNNQPVPFTAGDTLIFTMRTAVGKVERALQKKVTTFTDNKAVITLDPVDTAAMDPVKYQYDVWCTRANGKIDPIIAPSDFNLQQSVTDSEIA